MKLQALWRYPVKSLLGEPLQEVCVEERGISGDRQYALQAENGKLGSGKTSNRFQRIDKLLSLSAQTRAEAISITFPDGNSRDIGSEDLPQLLSGYLGQSVTIARETQISHFDDGPIHIALSSELRKLQALLPDTHIDARRFRPNLVLDCPDHMTSDGLLGCILAIGDTRLKITHKTERCVMVTMEQEKLPKAPLILRQVSQTFDLNFGLYARVLKPGMLRTGQTVEISSRTSSRDQGAFGL